MSRHVIRVGALMLGVLVGATFQINTLNAKEVIPRRVLFGDPDRAGVEVSPDGKRLSYLAPADGVLNVWVAPIEEPDKARPVTHDTKRGVHIYNWAFTSNHILYMQDEGGNENFNVFVVDLSSGETKNLTPKKTARAQIEAVSDRLPDEILVAINDRTPFFFDTHRINLRTGEDKLLARNPGTIGGNMVQGILTDDDYRVRFALTTTADGGAELLTPKSEPQDGNVADWEPFQRIPMDDAMSTRPFGFNKTGDVAWISDSRGRDTAALFALDLKSGEKKLLAEDPHADVGGVIVHPTEKFIQAVSFEHERQEWKVLDDSIRGDMDRLKTVADGDLNVLSRSHDDRVWIVAYVVDNGPVRYYRYDRPAKKATFLFTNRSELEKQPLARMYPLVIKSRDGLNLVSYLTLPREAKNEFRPDGVPVPRKPLPLVLFVHGGPWGRDSWGLNSIHQWLADRGYAVLSVNFRGSVGFGKAFVNAGNHQWGAKMHDDLIDAVQWATENRIAQKDRVAIMGGSYGGYATLVGLTFTPDRFACGVDIVGPSRLVTLLQTIPPYWAPVRAVFAARVGDISTPEGIKFLDSRSPLTFVERIKKPLLIGQGKNDPRVKQAEADQIVKAMQQKQLPVTYVLYSDEGHGFVRPENRLSFNAVAEQFLAQHLGGRAEPIGSDFKSSTIAVPQGADQIRGLPDALSHLPARAK